jgi:hypothetical protein
MEYATTLTEIATPRWLLEFTHLLPYCTRATGAGVLTKQLDKSIYKLASGRMATIARL